MRRQQVSSKKNTQVDGNTSGSISLVFSLLLMTVLFCHLFVIPRIFIYIVLSFLISLISYARKALKILLKFFIMETRSAKMLLILSAASDKVRNKNKPERGRPAKRSE